MPDNPMYQETLEAIRQGQRSRARDLLTRLLRADSSNPEYWLWMSSVVDSPREQIYCLQSALRLDPNNSTARRGLVLLGALPPAENLVPKPMVKRRWEVTPVEVPKGPGLGQFLNNMVVQVVFFSLLGVGILALIGYAILQNLPQPSAVTVRYPTETPGIAPTFTNTPTSVNVTAPVVVAATRIPPTPTGLMSFSLIVGVAYTPTPLYFATPHGASEPYAIAMRAFLDGNWERALRFMQQAAQIEPQAVDIRFLIGEILRHQGERRDALAAYQDTLALDPNFAPAYLGIARLKLAADPESDVSADLQQAIRRDPYYGEAYLERVDYYLNHDDFPNAVADLDIAAQLLPYSPLVHLYRARISLANGDPQGALDAALEANEIDRTILEAYHLIGQAAWAAGERILASQNYNIYLTYAPSYAPQELKNIAIAATEYGQLLFEEGEYAEAEQVLTLALTNDQDLVNAYLYRGLARIELGQGQAAVNDLVRARSFNSSDFTANLGLARALWTAERPLEARAQCNITEGLAATPVELAQVYYWRARINESLGELQAAAHDWNALLLLDPTAVPPGWLSAAQNSLATLTALAPASATTIPGTPTLTSSQKLPTRTPTP